ncbi:high-affinity nickel-transport protein [Paraburkholderia silvatlantica]|uniref:Nickel/cobalt efflux system n=2 Tax=Paraburkholderia silvatlantica TaxID=321895 RepID=A0ABR6FUU6_9BURK|nr:HoxN/HupN/NixA family nickel/cobalt transporter [Paraburkholderia silvatlantica]MBB2931212.1 high-affinity nickel-transport protein [Paraburkholderia silvatlantica]PVY28628.1 high-affinity nickel-transport protein [Paraburkholderia silvatlantica]PXW36265.1 high-affinity nickel-transport protein [Paraburkholderia silvatlantica]
MIECLSLARRSLETAGDRFEHETMDIPLPPSPHRPPSLPKRSATRAKIGVVLSMLLACNLAAWCWAVAMFGSRPALLGACMLAYTFGLRHAVDADHIAAIDNVTRKLMHDGKRPVTIGLMFSLGHSTIVVLASAAIAAAAFGLRERLDAVRDVAGTIATAVSTVFLFAIAISNLLTLRAVIQSYRRTRPGSAHDDAAPHAHGLLARVLRPLTRIVTKSWHMYVLGVLFGLGFDTATEIGVLGLSAASATHDLPIWSIMVFPALFTAGMTLIDTADGMLMLGVYGWALRDPARKHRYNVGVTALSAALALLIGGIEGIGLIGDKFALHGSLWDGVGALDAHLGSTGYAIVAVFAGSWLFAAGYQRRRVRTGARV